ncbi:MAG TPA: universal stress protein [Candidatus Acidoferrales bacterium]|jgi:two-component system, OmpR family, sensor histidine kinase KdpD|nr:universal stress protein [Candidatus Acidoferrales bacterium]
MPKTPEDWLEKASAPEKAKGIFKLFLGYAPGVGKTYSMLSEGIRRHNRGEDVVIGFIETHGRKGVEELVPELETVPRRSIEYKGTVFEEMDVDAIIARRPAVVLVDELAHTNIPGSKHRKRYEDLLELLNAKIDVLSTLNIQHMESLAPTVHSITGVTVRETVPDWVPLMANETVMVDLTPEALQQRMERGDVYSKHKVHQALHNFFRRGNLIALRELALRQVAEHVDRSLESYMAAKDIEKNWPVRERLAVCISSNPSGQYLIARGARMARRLDAELYVVHVDTGVDNQGPGHKSLEANIRFAGDLGAKVVRIKGKNIADTMAAFAREKHVTQVIFGRAAVKGLRKLLYLSAIHRFLRDAPAVDVHIVTHQDPD